jgi:hypothetical protein
MSFDPPPLPPRPATFDVSGQYDVLATALRPVFALLGVGLVLVEGLTWISIREHTNAPTSPSALGILILIAVVFGAAFALLGVLLRTHALRTIRVDESGVHVLRRSGTWVDQRWDDPSFRLQFRERTPSPGVRADPRPNVVGVEGAGFPSDLQVPYRFYVVAVETAAVHRLTREGHFEEYHGRFGPVYWWVTSLGAVSARSAE